MHDPGNGIRSPLSQTLCLHGQPISGDVYYSRRILAKKPRKSTRRVVWRPGRVASRPRSRGEKASSWIRARLLPS